LDTNLSIAAAGCQAPATRLRIADPTSGPAREALRAYMDEVVSRYQGRPAAPEEVDQALRDFPSDDLRPPGGAFVLALDGGEAVGCGGVSFHEGAIAELTRIYVAPAARRRGLGRRIVTELERAALENGRTLIRLDTRADLVEARAMYAALGYREVAPFNDGPYADHWFEKRLS
jgi:ribosomal protein S18 acetylase RimI-like enzyme